MLYESENSNSSFLSNWQPRVKSINIKSIIDLKVTKKKVSIWNSIQKLLKPVLLVEWKCITMSNHLSVMCNLNGSH